MKVKWYWLAEWMGLMEDISAQYNDGYTHYTVSSQCDRVFSLLYMAQFPLLFLAGFLLAFLPLRAGRAALSKALVRSALGLLLAYAVLLAVGVGPYIQFYPQSSGFLSFDVLEHTLSGMGCGLLAMALWLGSRLGRRKGISTIL